MTTPDNAAPSRTPGGPHSGILGLVSLGLLLASLIAMVALSGGAMIASPFGDTTSVAGFFAHHTLAARVSALLQFGSAIPLGIYTATVYSRQRQLGIRVPGPAIGQFGGIFAAILLAVSAIVTWTQSQPVVSPHPELTHAFAYVAFATGGFAHVVGLGLLVAGLAVPALILRTMPTWVSWTGLAIALLAELSFLTMVLEPVQYLIPVGRFGSLIWLIAAGFLLPRTRPARSDVTNGGGR